MAGTGEKGLLLGRQLTEQRAGTNAVRDRGTRMPQTDWEADPARDFFFSLCAVRGCAVVVQQPLAGDVRL